MMTMNVKSTIFDNVTIDGFDLWIWDIEAFADSFGSFFGKFGLVKTLGFM